MFSEGSGSGQDGFGQKVCDYLAEMLSSFERTNSGIIYWKERGTWHKKRFSTLTLYGLTLESVSALTRRWKLESVTPAGRSTATAVPDHGGKL